MATLSLELSDDAIRNLNALAEQQHVSVAGLIESFAVQPYFELSDEQMAEVDEGLAAIHRGEVASDEEMKAFFEKYA